MNRSTSKSKIQDELLSRCRHRIGFIKEAVSSRNAFAVAHFQYALCLKNTGAALTDYISEELSHHSTSASAPATPRIYFPRRLLSFQNLATFLRSVSMPAVKLISDLKSVGTAATEELELEQPDMRDPISAVVDPVSATLRRALSMPELKRKTNRRALQEDSVAVEESIVAAVELQIESASLQRAASMPEAELRSESNLVRPAALEVSDHQNPKKPILEPQFKPPKKLGKRTKTGKLMSLIQIFHDLDDHFLKASEVCKIMDAAILGHYSPLTNDQEHSNLSAHVMIAITWNRTMMKKLSHPPVLDSILLWEKKLCDEVKACETVKHEYQEKVASLNKKKKEGTDLISSEKFEAATYHLRMRYIVNMQSMNSTIAQIHGLRDEQLYSELLLLLDGMATMWETMRHNHETQAGFVDAIKSLHRFQPQDETSSYYRHRLTQLFVVVREWYMQFCRLIDCQKDHVRALHNWLNIIHVQDKAFSSPRDENLPIHELVKVWNDAMDELPDEIARSAIRNFASVVLTIIQQDEKTKLREKCEATRRELDRKIRQYEVWCMKHGVIGYLDSENPLKTAKEEREMIVVTLKEQLEECQKMFNRAREKSLARLTHQLLDVFRAMSEIAQACSIMYRNLRLVVED